MAISFAAADPSFEPGYFARKTEQVKTRNHMSFAMPFQTKNASFYQDRLGTNMGKALKKELMRFLAAAVSEPRDAGGVDGGEPAGVWTE